MAMVERKQTAGPTQTPRRSSWRRRTEHQAGGRLLLTDAGVAFVLINERRRRTLKRVFGIPGEHADVATLVAGLLLAQAVHKGAKRLLRVPDLPSAGDAALGASAVRQVVLGVAGPSSDETPLVGTLIAIAVVGKLARPVIDRAVHGMEASAHRMRAAFNRRYGYLIVHARRVVPREGDRSRAA